MKVTLEKDYRNLYTLTELDAAKKVIAAEKDNGYTNKEAAEYAVREALKDTGDVCYEVITATATTALNNRAWELYGPETGHMDVLVEALAKTSGGYIEVTAYLSDIWQTGAIDYRDKMYIAIFKKQ